MTLNPHDPVDPAGELAENLADPPPRAVGSVICPQCRYQFVPVGGEVAGRVTETTTEPVADRVAAAVRRLGIDLDPAATTEALINGVRSWDDRREQLRTAVRARLQADAGDGAYCWVMIVDATDTHLVYATDYDATARLWQCEYTITGDTVELGEPVAVERSYSPSPTADPGTPATETVRTEVAAGGARVLEAKGTDDQGHRVYRVRVIAYGDSKNRRRYPEAVLRGAVALYDGAKAYDHHRTEEEMRTGTVVGLVGYYTDPAAGETGVEADLHILPSRADVAEALDAALQLAESAPDAEPLVGISHDVYATFRPIREGGQQLQEATSIDRVYSADVVAHPAAGGRPTRVVAGGIDDTDTTAREGADVGPTTADVLAALAAATPDQLAAHGLTRAGETTPPAAAAGAAPAAGSAPVVEYDRDGWLGKAMITGKLTESGLPESALTAFAATLPDKITESVVDAQLAVMKSALSLAERAQLTPTVTTQVTKEAVDKKLGALDKFWDGDFSAGYRSLRHAWMDFTGYRESFGSLGEDVNRRMLAESAGFTPAGGRFGYDSARGVEALQTASWSQALGDSITRRMMRLYAQPDLQGWRNIVSDVVPVSDFRNQERARIGGYGLLPVVNEAAPYQPLTSPGDESAVYKVIKRGGTESLTLEMIANDDIGAIRQIPRALGLAAAITLYRFVFDMLATNVVTSYDATALFAAGHNNTDNPALLGQSALDAARAKMRQQTAYGDATNILSIRPKTLVVPPALESLGFQLSRSAVAIPDGGVGASDTPNIHAGLQLEVVDYLTDTNDWFLVADPQLCPTIEVGFYQGREDPELFTQADPTVGSMFDTDSVTYKLRHIYSGTPLDHRGFYRGTNA